MPDEEVVATVAVPEERELIPSGDHFSSDPYNDGTAVVV